ncbi:MAG: ABC transporter permease subunit [Sulfolobales archaeon]
MSLLNKILFYMLSLIIILSVWEFIALAISRAYFPTPIEVFERVYIDLANTILITNLAISLQRIFLALAIALISGLLLGISATWSSRISRSIISNLILLTYPIPHITLLPIFFFFLGVEWSKIALLSLITFYPIALSVMEWSSRFPRDLSDLIFLMRGDKLHIIRYVVLPSALPGILTGFRIALNTAFAVIFIVESLVGSGGIGYLIYLYWQKLDYTGMYASIAFLSLVGISLYLLLKSAEHRLLKWLYR